MKEIYFENVTGIGNLYLEKVFNKFEDENIIFICSSEQNKRYFCLCYEFRNALKWILCEISINMLISVIMKKIDIRSVFELSSNNLVQIIYKDGEECSEEVTMQQMESSIFPAPQVFLKTDDTAYKYVSHICVDYVQAKSYSLEHTLSYTVQAKKLNTNNMQISYDSSTIPLSYNLQETCINLKKEAMTVKIDKAA